MLVKRFCPFGFPKMFAYLLILLLSIHTSLAGFTYEQRMEIAQEKVRQNEAVSSRQFFEFQDLDFVVFPGVFSPIIFPSSKAVSRIPIQKGESVLEIGSGTGIFSILAALDGAEKVVAVDINPDAVENTKANARIHQVEDRVIAIEGDIFDSIDEKFDVIFWNIPLADKNVFDGETLSLMELAAFDPGHAFLHRYLKEGAAFLNPGGRLLLVFSTTHGNVQRMHQWAADYHWETQLLSKDGDENNDFITIELYQFTQKVR